MFKAIREGKRSLQSCGVLRATTLMVGFAELAVSGARCLQGDRPGRQPSSSNDMSILAEKQGSTGDH